MKSRSSPLPSVFILRVPTSTFVWTLSVNCEPGLLMDVLQNLKEKIDKNLAHAECALLCDAMSIKSSVYYNHSTGGW